MGESRDILDDPDETFDLINDDDEVIGRVRRGAAHADPSLLHRSVQVLIFDTDGRVLLQRRSQRKDLFPGFFCASASGHVASGEGYAMTAEREVREELGVSLPLTYAGKRLVRSPRETEMTALFLARSDGPFHFHPTETDGGVFVSLAELGGAHTSGSLPLTPALMAALEMLGEPPAADALRRVLAGETGGGAAAEAL